MLVIVSMAIYIAFRTIIGQNKCADAYKQSDMQCTVLHRVCMQFCTINISLVPRSFQCSREMRGSMVSNVT